MSDRFTPVPMGMGGGQAETSAPAESSRFTAVPMGMGGGQMPQQPSGGSTQGGIDELGLSRSLLGTGAKLSSFLDQMPGLDNFDLGGYGLGELGAGLGGATSGLGLLQSFQNPASFGSPMGSLGALQNLYGLYSGANSALGLGGPTIGSAITGSGSLGAGLGSLGTAISGAFGIPAAAFAALGATDMFDTSAQGFKNNVNNTFGAVPGNVQRFQAVPNQLASITPQSSLQDIQSMWNRLQGTQEQFQNTGVENLLKSAGTLTGENTKFGFFGGGDNYSASYPNIQGVQNAIDPGWQSVLTGRFQLADQAGRMGGTAGNFTPEDYARQFAPQAFLDALNPWGSQYSIAGRGVDAMGQAIPITQEQQYTLDNILAKLKAIQPGTMEQSLANIFAPYGGWGTKASLMGPGRLDLNTVFAAPDANALTQRIGLTPEQQAAIAAAPPPPTESQVGTQTQEYFQPQGGN